MCGLCGILLCPRPRTQQDLHTITGLFVRLLLASEHRGPLATGVALVTASREVLIEKAPLPAHRFIMTEEFHSICARITAQTTVLMGHTRWPTQGSHYCNQNNQPLVIPGSQGLVLTHNGNISQVDRYFARFRLKREWEVDSELLLRLAHRHTSSIGIDHQAFLSDLAICHGHLAATIVTTAQPGTMMFLRRDRPLHLAWHPTRHLLAYASERNILQQTLYLPKTWQYHAISPNTVLIVDSMALPTMTMLPL